MQTRELSEVLSNHASMHQGNPAGGQLDVFDLCGYSTRNKFEYPPRSELLSTPPLSYSTRHISKIEWSINDLQTISTLRVSFSDGRHSYTSPLFCHPTNKSPRIQSCVSIPYDESLKNLSVTADPTQVYQVALRSEFLEYPAFLHKTGEEKVVTEFELTRGQQIIGVYGCWDTKNRR